MCSFLQVNLRGPAHSSLQSKFGRMLPTTGVDVLNRLLCYDPVEVRVAVPLTLIVNLAIFFVIVVIVISLISHRLTPGSPAHFSQGGLEPCLV